MIARDELALRLPGQANVVSIVIALAFASLALSSAYVAVLPVADWPASWMVRVLLFCGAAVGVTVGASCVAFVMQALLQAVVPSRVVGDAAALRVEVWRTWSGLWEGFLRTSASVPRSEIRGVGYSRGQGGETQVFVLHRSGHAIGTGYGGGEEEARRVGAAIVGWASGGGENEG